MREKQRTPCVGTSILDQGNLYLLFLHTTLPPERPVDHLRDGDGPDHRAGSALRAEWKAGGPGADLLQHAAGKRGLFSG